MGKPKKIPAQCAICRSTFWSVKAKRARFCSPRCNGVEQSRLAVSRLSERFWSKVNREGPIPEHRPELGPCWVWTYSRDQKGYGHFGALKRKVTRAHRVAWFLEHGSWPQPCALHKCDNRACVRPDHLFEGDNADNMRDMVAKGRDRHLAGSQNGRAKLSEEQVSEIRRRLAAGERQNALAREFGIGLTTMSHLANGHTWRSVA